MLTLNDFQELLQNKVIWHFHIDSPYFEIEKKKTYINEIHAKYQKKLI